MKLTFIRGPEWSLMTPLEWAVSGFEIKFRRVRRQRTNPELDELIEENWEKRQDERRSKGVFVEEDWPKTGYRGHCIDTKTKELTVFVSSAGWRNMQGTHYNPKFYKAMLKRFNRYACVRLSLGDAHSDKLFKAFIRQYLDGAISQCSAIETKAGFPLGFRSNEVGVAPGIWHVPGGYLPDIGHGIYKSEVPVVDGKPIVDRETFTPDVGSMKDNAMVNLYKESGGKLNPKATKVIYTGMIYEMLNHAVQFISLVETDLGLFGTNWEHETGKMRHYKLDDIPDLLNQPGSLPGSILKGGQACLAVAYIRKKGLGSVDKFGFIEQVKI